VTRAGFWAAFRAAYFRTRSIERWRDGRVYELLGIRLFKRYLPTTGDLVSRLRGRRWVRWAGDLTERQLADHERRTRSWEGRHIFGGLSMLALTWWSVEVKGKGDWLALLVGNLLINGYPILLQRYNRVRLQSAMARLERRSVACR
jgi:hypothetical protein